MKARKITSAELARAIGIAKSNFSQWRMNRNQPGYGVLVRIARFFGVSVEYLECKTDDPSVQADENKGAIKYQSLEREEFMRLVDSLPDSEMGRLLVIFRAMFDLQEKERGQDMNP